MSVPVRFDVVLNDGSILRNQSFGTVSYGDNMSSVINNFKYLNRYKDLSENNRSVFCPWIKDVNYFWLQHNGMIIKFVDLEKFENV